MGDKSTSTPPGHTKAAMVSSLENCLSNKLSAEQSSFALTGAES